MLGITGGLIRVLKIPVTAGVSALRFVVVLLVALLSWLVITIGGSYLMMVQGAPEIGGVVLALIISVAAIVVVYQASLPPLPEEHAH
jgi:uncharacterized membrane protein